MTFRPGFVRKDGTVRFQFRDDQTGEPVGTLSLPGVYLPGAGDVGPDGLYSHAAAERLGLRVEPSALLLDFAHRLPTQDEQDAAQAAL